MVSRRFVPKPWGALPIAGIMMFAFMGTVIWIGANAATTQVGVEPESGLSAAGAQQIANGGASGGQAIRFRHEFGTLSARQPAGNPRYAWRMFGGSDDPARIPVGSRSDYAIYLLSPYMVQVAQSVKASNPQSVIYMYKDATSARGSSPSAYGSWCNADGGTLGHDWGVDYCDAYANHGPWFMTLGGQKFEYNGYQYHWHMNVAAAGYKERWVSNVLADLQSNSVWDGVFVDNVMADIRAYVPGGGYPDQYGNLGAGQAIYTSFMGYVGSQLRAAGYGVIGNNNGVRLYPGLWDSYTSQTSGGFDEFWTTFGGSAGSPNNLPLYDGLGWEAQIQEVESLGAVGKLAIAVGQDSGGACTECTRYGVASYLLANNGWQAYQAANVDGEIGDFVSGNVLFSWQLGEATSGRTEPQPNLFQRTFSSGLVLVNASNTTSRTVTLPGTYRDESGSSVTTVTVPPVRGRILRTP